VERPPEPPNLVWKNPTTEPTFTMINGGCNYVSEVYFGDVATGCTATIINSGGTFNGTITVTFYWRQDAVNIASVTVPWSGILVKGQSKLFSTDIPVDPLNQPVDPYVTYESKDYTVKAVSNQISGSITSGAKPGKNPSYPDCIP